MCCELSNDILTAFRSYLSLCVEGITVNVQQYIIGWVVHPYLQHFMHCVLHLHTRRFHVGCAEMRMIMYAVKAQLDTLNIS